MSYLQYWKLGYAPFSSNSAFFTGGSVEEAIARVCFLVKSQRRMGVLVGPSSVGKTLLLKHLRKPIATAAAVNRPKIVYQSLLGLNPSEFFASLSRTIGEGLTSNAHANGSEDHREKSAWNQLKDALVAATAFSTQVVLLLDDISFAKEPMLGGIHQIMEASQTVTCVLGVCSESVDELPLNLRERCQLRVDLPAWDLGQTADYFDFVLSKAKGRPGIFEAQAITRIHELSDGLPQRLNRLAELALVAGASKRIPRITSELADQVFDEFSLIPAAYAESSAR
ncbi:MAG: AAA family ATPase [Pirellulaceae bacterium]|nr:AAA family ATPase [Pirellulaceae bacterium]